MKKKDKVIIVCGPTGSGKSDLALKVAREYNGELINIDSRQIYKYLDIGTNKDVPTENSKFQYSNPKQIPNYNDLIKVKPYKFNGISIHLISFLNPDHRFDVFKYKKLAEEFIDDVLSRGKLPILVGGTGLYIDALVKNYQVTEFDNSKIRKDLENLNATELQQKLRSLNEQTLESMNNSDLNNPRRLIRTIEKEIFETDVKKADPKHDFKMLYPEFDWEYLLFKLDKRVDQMFRNGIIKEVKKVLEMGFPEDSIALQGIGYREVLSFLNGEISINECIEKVKSSHRQYAKRQRTWFEGQGRNYDLQIVSDSKYL